MQEGKRESEDKTKNDRQQKAGAPIRSPGMHGGRVEGSGEGQWLEGGCEVLIKH